MDETKKLTTDQLAERIVALEFQVNKLDRLVYKLFEQLKRMTFQRTAN
jgi:hypothetical protein